MLYDIRHSSSVSILIADCTTKYISRPFRNVLMVQLFIYSNQKYMKTSEKVTWTPIKVCYGPQYMKTIKEVTWTPIKVCYGPHPEMCLLHNCYNFLQLYELTVRAADSEVAIEKLTVLSSHYPKCVFLCTSMATALAQAERTSDALQAFRKARQINGVYFLRH